MPHERFFIEKPLKENEILLLNGKEFHHLSNVMRMKANDQIEVVNGMGDLGIAIIQSIQKKEAHLFISQVTREAPPPFTVILAQAIPRFNRLDFILEKAVELGATEIWLFPGDYSERKEINETQLERFYSVLIAAMKQCGRLHLLKIVLKPKLSQFPHLPYTSFFGDTEKNVPPLSSLDLKNKEGIIFFIGPESGFSEKETEKLKSLGAKGVTLNPYILRTDTAALTALSLISAYLDTNLEK